MSSELDNDFIQDKEFPFRETLRWWEKRRLWFNLAIIAFQILMILDYRGMAVFNLRSVIIFSLFYLFAANVGYCLGWGIEFLITFYTKSNEPRIALRRTMFVLGLLFSIVTTLSTYHDFFWLGAMII